MTLVKPKVDTSFGYGPQMTTEREWDEDRREMVEVEHYMGSWWVVACLRHGTIEDARDEADAWNLARDPHQFCPDCAEEWREWGRHLPLPAPTDLDADRAADLARMRRLEEEEREIERRHS